MSDTLITVDNVSKKFCRSLKKSLWYGVKDMGAEFFGRSNSHNELREGEFWANKDISFEVKQGESIGLIGHNGAGKTTLLRMLNGLIKPDKGNIEIRGRMQALIALGAGFNPILTGRENVYVNAAVLRISKTEVDRKFDEIVDFSGIGEFIDAPVQSYSSGMVVRLGFAVASNMEPDILLVDEVLAVGDSEFQRKCQEKINSLVENGVALIIVSHNMNHVYHICKKSICLESGKILFYGNTVDAIKMYENKSLSSCYIDEDSLERTFQIALGPVKSSTGEIIISDIRISNSSGIMSGPFNTGENIIISADFIANKEISNPIVQISIHREDGVTCIVERTSDHSISFPNLNVGSGTFSFIINELPLKTANYVVELLVSDKMAVVSYARHRSKPFAILSRVPSYKVGHMGMFQIPVEYRLNDLSIPKSDT